MKTSYTKLSLNWNTVPFYKTSMKPQQSTRALSRGLHIIDVLAEGRDGLPLTEIARKAGLSKSSTHRLLQTLAQEGFVAQDGHSSHYRLSLKLLWLTSSLVDGLGLDQLVRPLLEELAHATRETVHMALLDGLIAVYVEKIDSPNSIRMYSRVGKRVPLHCTGLGKAILAYLPEERVREIVATEGLPRRTANTITKPRALYEHLAAIRSRGYALDEEEHEEGVRCIAAPLFDRQKRVVGAISITALTFRVERDRLLSWWPQLRHCAEKVTMVLEHHSA